MRTPGFHADKSLYRSKRNYRSKAAWPAGPERSVLPQQDDRGVDGGTCCGTKCPGLCVCVNGVGQCGAATRTPANRVMMAASSLCHASGTVVLSDGSVATPIAICPGACWASTYDAGCLGGGEGSDDRRLASTCGFVGHDADGSPAQRPSRLCWTARLTVQRRPRPSLRRWVTVIQVPQKRFGSAGPHPQCRDLQLPPPSSLSHGRLVSRTGSCAQHRGE